MSLCSPGQVLSVLGSGAQASPCPRLLGSFFIQFPFCRFALRPKHPDQDIPLVAASWEILCSSGQISALPCYSLCLVKSGMQKQEQGIYLNHRGHGAKAASPGG